MSYTFQMTSVEEVYSPPEQVLDCTVIGTTVFLDICKYDETTESRRLSVIASIAVDAHAFIEGMMTSAKQSERDAKAAVERKQERQEATSDRVGNLHTFVQNPRDATETDCDVCGRMKEVH